MSALEDTRSPIVRPPDFAQFWRQTLAELDDTPPAWERIPDLTWTTPRRKVDWLRFHSFQGQVIYGWLACETRGETDGQQPGYLWLPGYSHGNPPPGPESLYNGVITLGLNLHGNTPDTPYIHPSTQGGEYITRGIDSPETYVFREIAAHCVQALRVLAEQPDVDANSVFVGGMSQGGGLALITAALANQQTRLCLADMPWLCNLDLALSLIDRERTRHLPNYRIPDPRSLIEDYANAHPERRERIYETYRYFDPLSHAPDILCPTQMSAGGRDPSCKPPTIYSVYNALGCPKEMLYLPTTGHEIVPAMHTEHLKWVSRLKEQRGRQGHTLPEETYHA